MRHNKKFNHLSRTASHRSSMLSNMACSLIMHKRITTTLAKAKALKKFVEPLITRAKDDTTTSRRVVFRHLQDKYAVKELFGNVAEKVGDRPGGYTRVIRLGIRQGDAAEIAFIELVDFDPAMAKTEKVGKKTRRSRRSKKAENVTLQQNDSSVESTESEKSAKIQNSDQQDDVKVEAEEPVEAEAQVEAEAKVKTEAQVEAESEL